LIVPDGQPFPPGSRRVRRSADAPRCPVDGVLLGRGYLRCVVCTEFVDQFWWVDWSELLAAELITAGGEEERALAQRVLAAEVGAFSWTCVDWAMTLSRCPHCAHESGAGPLECLPCRLSEENRWAWDHHGYPRSMTAEEHALRVARVTLRAPHRRRTSTVARARLVLPFLLAGQPLPRGRWLDAYLLAGRYHELSECTSAQELASFPSLPFRQPVNGAVTGVADRS